MKANTSQLHSACVSQHVYYSAHYFFSFTENAYEISIVASKEIIDNDFIPSLIMAQCHDMRSSSDCYRVLQVDDEGGQGTVI